MDCGELANTAATAAGSPITRPARIWGFWGTALWGLFVFAAMAFGQIAAVALLSLRDGQTVVGGSFVISLAVIVSLPAVLAALWIVIRIAGTPFASYLALRRTSWKNFVMGALGLALLILGWGLLSRAIGREIAPGFMVHVLKSAREEGVLWVIIIAFAVAAPISEELFVRGFLYRGWSESVLGPFGAIVLSSIVWTSMHLQYDWYFFGEVFSIGILLGYLRYRHDSTWPTIFVHGLNNLAAVTQILWLVRQS